jgi:hypothetical protein
VGTANNGWTGQTNLALAEFIMRPQAEALQIGAVGMLRETTSGCQLPRKSTALVGKTIDFLAQSDQLRREARWILARQTTIATWCAVPLSG